MMLSKYKLSQYHHLKNGENNSLTSKLSKLRDIKFLAQHLGHTRHSRNKTLGINPAKPHHTHTHHQQRPYEQSDIYVFFFYNHSLDDLIQFYGSEHCVLIDDFQMCIFNLYLFPELLYSTATWHLLQVLTLRILSTTFLNTNLHLSICFLGTQCAMSVIFYNLFNFFDPKRCFL